MVWLALFLIFLPLVPGLDHGAADGTIPPLVANVFVGGGSDESGAIYYRIPALAIGQDGTLLAFAERRRSPNDPGHWGFHADIVLRRSVDEGRTWGEATVLASDARFDYSDPRLIVDGNGRVIAIYARWADNCGQMCATVGDDRNKILYRWSDNNGVSWSNEAEIDVRGGSMQSINSGPGVGVVTASGRLLFPAIARVENQFRTFSIYSDDGGERWQRGEFAPVLGASEGDAVVLQDGRLLLTVRNDGALAGNRFFLESDDNGVNWDLVESDGVVVTRVDGSMVRDGERLLFSAPIGEPAGVGRVNLGVWESWDNGRNFGRPTQIVNGFSAYSAMVVMGHEIGILYEAEPYTLIRFVRYE